MLIGRHLFTLFLSALLLCLVSMGCGDSNIFEDMANDNTREAKLEEAQIALDKADYTKAIEIFLDLCGLDPANPTSNFDNRTCDNSTISLLASAYMGKAGIDLINIIENTDNSTGQQDVFAAFSGILIKENEEDLGNAVALLSSLQGRTEEEDLQMAVAAAADTVLTIMNIPGLELNQEGIPTTLPVTSEINAAATEITDSNDISLIIDGVAGSGITDENLTQGIDTLQTSISGTDTAVTPEELENFLCSLNTDVTGC